MHRRYATAILLVICGGEIALVRGDDASLKSNQRSDAAVDRPAVESAIVTAARGPVGNPSLEPSTVSAPPRSDANALPPSSGPAAGVATESKPPLAPPDAALTRQKLEEHLERAQKSGLDDATKAELSKRYRAALDWLIYAEDAAEKTLQYQADVEQCPQRITEVKSKLAVPPTEPSVECPPGTTLLHMEQQLSEADADRQEAIARLAKREEELKRRGERKAELTALCGETKQRIEEAEKQGPGTADSEPADLAAARRMESEARLKALASQLALHRAEQQRLDARGELLPLERDLANRKRLDCEKRVAILQGLVARARATESERQAQAARRQLSDTDPDLRDLAENNSALAEEFKRISASTTAAESSAKSTEQRLDELNKDLQSLQEKARYAGHSTSIGLLLRKARAELPDPLAYQAKVEQVADEMQAANLARIETEEQRSALSDFEAAVVEALAGIQSTAAGSDQPLREQTVRELLESKRSLLDKLSASYETYLASLSQLDLVSNKLIKETETLAEYIDENVLWIRSAEVLNRSDFSQAWSGLLTVASTPEWFELAKLGGVDVFRRPWMMFGVAVFLAVLFTFHTRLRQRMRSLCTTASGSTVLNLQPTLEGLLLAALMASHWPILLAFAGWRMSSGEPFSDLGNALGEGLYYAAWLVWASEFTHQICKSGRIAETHFGWAPQKLGVVRRHRRLFTLLEVPLLIAIVFASRYRDGEFNESLGRIAFMAAMLVLAVCLHVLFTSKLNVFRGIKDDKRHSWLAHLKWPAWGVAVGLPVLLTGLAAIGYHYSAAQLALRLSTTLIAALTLVLIHAVGSRWFLVKRRNLALEQLRQRQHSDPNAAALPGSHQVTDDGRDLAKIHEELHYLLRMAITICLLVAGWLIWSDVLPALRALDSNVLWWTKVELVEMHEGLDGQPNRETVEDHIPTTLRHALSAGLILILTYLLGRNLPALLEITVLDRLPFDRGARHAISVLLRYAVAMFGIFLACRTLRVSWSSVELLVAGMTVGLGFGLQEIFANFVSGLILLFERPIRVGDVITLGDTTGMVTNIRIRATTVTNWDCKELIVPNKELISGRLLNWTLSNTRNRIVITVGLAYKTDTRRARAAIQAAAVEHSNVLEDPPPIVTFESFGDSALNFVLRCYLASMDIRLVTIHELHEAIHDRLNAEGMEIAFPQRDLHVRSIQPALLANPEAVEVPSRAA